MILLQDLKRIKADFGRITLYLSHEKNIFNFWFFTQFDVSVNCGQAHLHKNSF